MLYLLATILLNTLIYVFFKLFPKYKIDALQAIVVNYMTCVIVGSLLHGIFPVGANSISYNWLPWSLLMGVMLISLFNLIAYCTKREGITTTTVANKLSLVIPVAFSFWLYNEKFTVLKLMGIVLAFPAVYFTTKIKEDDRRGQELLWPVLLFLGSGLLDALLKYAEHNFLQNDDSMVSFTIHAFATASIIGLLLVVVAIARNKTVFHFRNIAAGLSLGIPNYFSIYYLIKLLNADFLQSSAAIPVNNIGIVVVSAICGVLLFKEKVPATRIIGLVLSIAAIALIAFGD